MSFVVPSGPPTSIQAIPLTSSSIKITWDPPRPSERNGQIIGYDIKVTKSGDSNDRDVYNVSGTDFSFCIEGILFSQSYLIMLSSLLHNIIIPRP